MKANILVVYYTGEYTRTLLPSTASLVSRVNPIRRARLEKRAAKQLALDVASLRLLEIGMRLSGHDSFRLLDVDYPSTNGIGGKPRWSAGQGVDFSVSHTAGMVGCAITSDCRVGCDLEQLRDTDPQIVRRMLRDDASLAVDLTKDNALSRWTQIESVLKGAGLGIMHAREIDWRPADIRLRDEQWWVHALPLHKEHVGHIAVDAIDFSVQVRAISDAELAD